MIENLSQNWLDAKQAEKVATERRRELEDKLLSLIGVAENMEGTENVETDGGYKIKITGRMTRKVNGERIQEIAAEEGLTDHLSSLFRWKPEINMTAWKICRQSDHRAAVRRHHHPARSGFIHYYKGLKK
jgi:hypothetical protein